MSYPAPTLYLCAMSPDLAEPPATGDAALDEALARVARLADAPLEEHPAVLAEAGVALQAFLDSHAS